MPAQSVTVTIPGKVMIAGEYSVLAGDPCIAFCVNRFMTISIRPCHQLELHSDFFPKVLTVEDLHDPEWALEPAVQLVREAYEQEGFDRCAVTVSSDLACHYGMGSSSALRLGLALGLKSVRESRDLTDPERWDCVFAAREQQAARQTRSSGYDMATQLSGGVIFYQMEQVDRPLTVAKLPLGQVALSKYVGIFVHQQGAPTAELLPSAWQWLQQDQRLESLRKANEELVQYFVSGRESLAELVSLVVRQRKVMDAHPAFPAEVQEALSSIPGFDEDFSFKTTGAGGRDAILVFYGEKSNTEQIGAALNSKGWEPIEYEISQQGCVVQREVH